MTTLCTIAIGKSKSSSSYRDKLERSVKEVISVCKKSDECKDLYLRFVLFDKYVHEIHHFQLLNYCKIPSYHNCLISSHGGKLAIIDAICSCSTITKIEAKKRKNCKAILFVIVDEEDRNSELPVTALSDTLENMFFSLDSFTSVLIGCNIVDESTGFLLSKTRSVVDMDYYWEFSDKEINEISEMISKFIIDKCKE